MSELVLCFSHLNKNAGPRQKSITVELALDPIHWAIAPRGPGPPPNIPLAMPKIS
jgi:hypothetical protein